METIFPIVTTYKAIYFYNSENLEKAIFWIILTGFCAIHDIIKYYGEKLIGEEKGDK
jgi:hypothetical protein